MARPFHWLYLQLADGLAHLLVPLMAACMPRRASNAFLRLASRAGWLMGPRNARAEKAIRLALPDQDLSHLQRLWRWNTLSEATDGFRLWLGLPVPMKRRGSWPESAGFLAVTIHMGIGIPALFDLGKAGLKPRLIYRPLGHRPHPGRPLMTLALRLRLRLMDRLCDNEAVATGSAYRKVRDLLLAGQTSVILVPDTPVEPTRATQWMTLGQARLATRPGLFRLMEETGRPMVFFVVRPDWETGWRHLEIEPAWTLPDAPEAFARRFEGLVAESPGLWQIWHGVEHALQADPVDEKPAERAEQEKS